jgi:TrmH family RNA methyltransferase
MEIITSTANALVKQTAALQQKKYRQETGTFLVEGLRNVEECVNYGQVKAIFYTATEDGRTLKLLATATGKGTQLYQTSAPVMKKLSETKSQQGVLAIVEENKLSLQDLQAALTKNATTKNIMLVVLDRVQDPGNMGTIIRTADAAGAAGIITVAGSVDVHSPKVVRAAMGSLLHMPVCTDVPESDLVAWCKKLGFKVAITTLEKSTSIYETDLTGRTAFVIGNEANGVSDSFAEIADLRLHIPMAGKAESLNAAVATGVVLFECLRQSK